MECSVLKVWVMLYDTDIKCMMLWDSRYHEILPELWGTECNAKTIVDSDNWIMDGTFKSAPNLFTQLFTINGLFPDGYRIPPSMVCSRGRLKPSTRTCLKKLTLGDPTSLPPSSWTMSLPSTTLLQRCVPQLPDGAATSISNSAVPVEASPAV